MTLLEAIILGIVQGITEWLPISSQGLSSLVMLKFFGKSFQEALFYSLWLHLGTLLAAVVYFRKDIKAIVGVIPRFFKSRRRSESGKSQKNAEESEQEHKRLLSFLFISTLFTGIVALPLLFMLLSISDFSASSGMALIGIFLIVTGFVQRYSKRAGKKFKKSPSHFDAILTGIAQALSVIPGLSRSGITTAMLLFRKFNAKEALRLSFLMSIPIVFLAQVLILLLGTVQFNAAAFIAVAFSFVFGLLTIHVLLRVAEKINFSYFAIILGLLSILAAFF